METNLSAEATANPQTEVSMEDRILNAMGEPPEPEAVEDDPSDIEPEETPEEEGAASDELETLELDGETWQVPKALKEGFLRQQDYTRKTQELAAERGTLQEQRQAIEAERQAFQQQVQAQQQNFQLHAQVAAIDQQLAQYANIDWQQLMESDPVQAMKLDRGLRDLKDMRNGVIQQALQSQQQMAQLQQQQMSQLLEQGRAELAKRIPDWSADKAKSLRDYGQTQGYTAEELGQLIDPRHVETLHKAMLYDQLMAAKPEISKKVAAAPKMVKSGAPQPKQSNTDVLRKIVKTSTDRNAKNQAIQRLLEQRL